MRAFVAIGIGLGEPTSRSAGAVLREAQKRILSADDAWTSQKWVDPANIHITLKFLGQIAEEDAPAMARAFADVAARANPFELSFAGVRAMPSRSRATMLWATFDDPAGAAADLATAIDRASSAFGVEGERRAFRPHATLVRARRPINATQALLAAETIPGAILSVGAVSFYSSTLTPRGPIYQALSNSPLRVG